VLARIGQMAYAARFVLRFIGAPQLKQNDPWLSLAALSNKCETVT